MRTYKVLSLALLVVAAAVFQTAFAQTGKPEQKLPMWSAKGKRNTVHFVGSIHFLKRDFYPLPAPIENAYSNATIVVFETEVDKMNDPVVLRKIMADGTYPPGKTIAQDVSKSTYTALRSTLQKKVGQPALFDRFKPYLVAVTLSALELQRLGFRPQDGVDQYFFTKAKTDKKEIRALESIETQMGYFRGMSKKEQEEFLKSSLKDMNQIEQLFGDIVKAWQAGDSKQLETLVMDALKEHPELAKKLLTDRNQNWMKDLEQLLQGDKDAFVVVGAAHLVGAESVVELLRAKGVTVQQHGAK